MAKSPADDLHRQRAEEALIDIFENLVRIEAVVRNGDKTEVVHRELGNAIFAAFDRGVAYEQERLAIEAGVPRCEDCGELLPTH